MPHLVRLYIRQVAIGYVLSAVFVGLLLATNVGNLWHLVTHVNVGWIAVLMLWVFNGIIFAGVQFALALPRGHGADSDGGSRRATPRRTRVASALVPVRIEERRWR